MASDKYHYVIKKFINDKVNEQFIALMDHITAISKVDTYLNIKSTNDLFFIQESIKLCSKIIFYTYFGEIVDNLPNNITIVEFYGSANGPINHLPESVKLLCLGKEFTHNIDNLPNNLETLFLNSSCEFNQSIDNLPQNLETLILGGEFNQPINNLPLNLKTLMFWCKFNHPLINLPPKLENLVFIDKEFNHSIDFLPNTIKHLQFHESYDKPLPNIPTSIEHLVIRNQDYNWAPMFQMVFSNKNNQ